MGSKSNTSITITNTLPTFAELATGTWFYWAGEEIIASNLKRKWSPNECMVGIDGYVRVSKLENADPETDPNYRGSSCLPWVESPVTVVDVELKVFVNNT